MKCGGEGAIRTIQHMGAGMAAEGTQEKYTEGGCRMSDVIAKIPWIKFSAHQLRMMQFYDPVSIGTAMQAAACYFATGQLPEGLEGIALGIFEQLREDIQDSVERYDRTCARNRKISLQRSCVKHHDMEAPEARLDHQRTSRGDQRTSSGDQWTSSGDQWTSSGDQRTSAGDQRTSRGDQWTSRGDQWTSTGDQWTSSGEFYSAEEKRKENNTRQHKTREKNTIQQK